MGLRLQVSQAGQGILYAFIWSGQIWNRSIQLVHSYVCPLFTELNCIVESYIFCSYYEIYYQSIVILPLNNSNITIKM